MEPRATLDDIDPASVQRFLKDARKAGRLPDGSEELPLTELLDKLHLLDGGKLTRAALVLFGRNPERFCASLSVKLGRFGGTEADLRFQEVLEGNLVETLPAILQQLDRKFFVKAVRFDGIHRIEEPPYPKAALREIFLNALVHRRYNSTTVLVRVFDDRLTVWNEGPLPDSITPEALFEIHPSVLRNRLIAEACFKAGYIDSWGLGIKKITEACRIAGLPIPTIESSFDGVQVTLTPPVTASVGRLIEIIGLEEHSPNALREGLGLTDRKSFRQLYIDPALALELIELTIPDKPKSRLQKYRLTEKGRTYFDAAIKS